jgi:hypothetical protein
MPARLTPKTVEHYYRLRREGLSMKQSANAAGVSYSWARQHESKMPERGAALKEAHAASRLGGPVPIEKLNPRAKRCLNDFDEFRATYLGHLPTPWQTEAAYRIVELLASPEKEYVVLNEPPGSGKSTMLHDVAVWMTVRNRAIRGVMGSATSQKAITSLRRIRRTLERTTPFRPPGDFVERGLACNAIATVAHDYGLFKPPSGGDLWRAEAFIVLQHGEGLIEEKEPTWAAFGMDQDMLGHRVDLVFWDDLVTNRSVRTVEAVDTQRQWYDTEAESRLEPGGAFFLVGQRVASNDLYRHCLDKKVLPDNDDEVESLEGLDDDEKAKALKEQPGLYKHIIYKAHDESRCTGVHGRDAPYWPEGCLLDPHRLSWRELRTHRANDAQKYATWYQQEDADPKQALVKPVWVTGGMDPEHGTQHFGCWDRDRELCEKPEGLAGPIYSIVGIDPSPTKMWAIGWFLYAPEAAHSLILMDTIRRSMPANELLDWNANTGEWYGVMEEWQQRSVELDLPITHYVVEVNAAQRFLLTYDHVRRWVAKNRVNLVPHTTTVRKNDDKLGVDMVRDWWRFARIRLPGKGMAARTASLKLVEEVQRYPNAFTDDQVMMHYFVISHLPEISAGWDIKEIPTFKRPTWLQGVHAGGRVA